MADLAAAKPAGRLSERVAVITGASGGIGRATAILFAREGAKVIVADVNENGGEETLRRIITAGGSGVFVRTDVTSDASIQEMVSRTTSLHQRIDILVANAGITIGGGVLALPAETCQHLLEVNLTSVYRSCRFVAPEIIKAGGGAIVIMSSCDGVVGHFEASAYAASKGGLISLARQLARQFAGNGIRVNAISPGFVLTPMADRMQNKEAVFEVVSDYSPCGHIGVPEDIAFACLYLASDESSYVTGHNLIVDGGITMRGV